MHRQVSGDTGTAAQDPGGVPLRGPAPTLVRLSSSGTRVGQGQSLVLAAQVSVLGGERSSAGTATGRVQFLDGNHLLGAAPLDDRGQAVLADVQLAPGVHAVTASYTGDPTHAAGTSAPLPQTVTTAQAPVSVLVSQPVRGADGLHLDAELLDLTTGRLATGTTGEVVFALDGVDVATAAVVEGRAQAVVPALEGGRLEVAYTGDAEHAPASGARALA